MAKTLPLPCVFHCLRGQDTAFACGPSGSWKAELRREFYDACGVSASNNTLSSTLLSNQNGHNHLGFLINQVISATLRSFRAMGTRFDAAAAAKNKKNAAEKKGKWPGYSSQTQTYAAAKGWAADTALPSAGGWPTKLGPGESVPPFTDLSLIFHCLSPSFTRMSLSFLRRSAAQWSRQLQLPSECRKANREHC